MLFRIRRKQKDLRGYKLEHSNLVLKIYKKGWEKNRDKLKDLKKKYKDNHVFVIWIDKQIERL